MANFNLFNTTINAGNNIPLVNLSQFAGTFEWDFGDGTTATTTDPEVNHTYSPTTNTLYRVRLIAIDNDAVNLYQKVIQPHA